MYPLNAMNNIMVRVIELCNVNISHGTEGYLV